MYIDFFIFSANPFPKRHVMNIVYFSVLYMIINCIFCFTVEPVYGIMNWRGWMGIVVIPLGLPLIAIVANVVFVFLSSAMHRCMGYDEIQNVIWNKKGERL